jgi:hypothetical protein
MRWLFTASIFSLLIIHPHPCEAFHIMPEVATFEGLAGSLTGEVQFLSATGGSPEGGVSLVGTPGLMDVSFTFRIVVDDSSQPLEDVVLSPGAGSALAAGWIPGATEPDGLVDLQSASTFLGNTTLTFSSPVLPGQTTNSFFVSFPEELFESESARWLFLGFYEPDNNFTTANTILHVVPEPSTGVLVLLGLGVLRIISRRLLRKHPRGQGHTAIG